MYVCQMGDICGTSGTSLSVILCAPRQPTQCTVLAALFSAYGPPGSSTALRGWFCPRRCQNISTTADPSPRVHSHCLVISISSITWLTSSFSTPYRCWSLPSFTGSLPARCTLRPGVLYPSTVEVRCARPVTVSAWAELVVDDRRSCVNRAVSRCLQPARPTQEFRFVCILQALS